MSSTPERRHPSYGSPRAVVDEWGHIEIEWPDPRPDHFEISSDLFASLIDELNEGRRLSDALDPLRDIIGEYRHSVDRMNDASGRAHV